MSSSTTEVVLPAQRKMRQRSASTSIRRVALSCLAILLLFCAPPTAFAAATRKTPLRLSDFQHHRHANHHTVHQQHQRHRNLLGIPLSNSSLRDAVELWFDNRRGAEATYGPMSTWNTHMVTDMSNLFEGRADYNGADFLSWNTSSVVDFSYMFAGCRAFNQDLQTLDFSAAKTLYAMFNGAVSFQQDLISGGWTQTKQVTNMGGMFKGAIRFDGNVAGLDTSNVEDMNMMFYGATSFTGSGIDSFDVSKVTRMDRTFMGASSFDGNIRSWRPSRVTTMQGMFEDASLFSQDIRGWNVSPQLMIMSSMFSGARSFTHRLCWSSVNPRVRASNMFCGSPGSLDEACYNPSVVKWAHGCDVSDGDFVAYYGDSNIDSASSDNNNDGPGFGGGASEFLPSDVLPVTQPEDEDDDDEANPQNTDPDQMTEAEETILINTVISEQQENKSSAPSSMLHSWSLLLVLTFLMYTVGALAIPYDFIHDVYEMVVDGED